MSGREVSGLIFLRSGGNCLGVKCPVRAFFLEGIVWEGTFREGTVRMRVECEVDLSGGNFPVTECTLDVYAATDLLTIMWEGFIVRACDAVALRAARKLQ